ncbi:hypothetical protein FQR65_LT11952 [Abscondita terminalis]|nr:hypothetical protein FQR65_LT11952 [Abscondita terminalis]
MILSRPSNVQDSERFDSIRKFLNGAVYIESSVTNEDDCTKKVADRKRISCSCSATQLCKTHENQLMCQKSRHSLFSSSSDVSAYDGNGSKNKPTTNQNPSKGSSISILSLSNTNSTIGTGTESHFQSWVARKIEEKRRILESQALLAEKREKEKQIRKEKEQENFKRWLLNKKKEQEEKVKKQKHKKIQQENVPKEQKKKIRTKEDQLRHELWCKRKEEQDLEKKLQKKLNEIKTSEEKQLKAEQNREAYQNWLKLSVNKPTPIPLGKGLETLRASVSVTYVNPIPWQPNIDINNLATS